MSANQRCGENRQDLSL